MPFLNDRLPFPLRTIALLLPLVLPVAGCGESGSGDFREYGQLDPVPGAEKPAATPETAPAGGQRVSPEAETAATPATAQQDSPSTADTGPASPVAAATAGTTSSNDRIPDSASIPAAERTPVAAPVPGAGPAETATAPARREPVVARRPEPSDIPATGTVARTPRVLIPEQTFREEGPEGALRVTYDDIDLLKVLNMDPVTADAVKLMPNWLKQLDGQRVRLRGFMYPPFQETGIQAFALARDNQICCFGKFPKIYDKFPVFLRKGHTTDYILNRSFDVVGVFHIDPIFDEETGEPLDLYLIDDAIVIDK
ncbi:MAG: hypothetical protein KDA79_12005 [Planctomycetaceae bacterium]|nr:hypothetical protein [Planctomycetaceae bacterium]